MIEEISISNFKRFRHVTLPLGRITVLAGVNGGGKSTIVQALNVVHQSALSNEDFVPLTGCPGIDLGRASDVLSAGASSDIITIGLRAGDRHNEWQFTGARASDAARLDVDVRPLDPVPPIGARGAEYTYLAAERIGPRTSHPTSPLVEHGTAVVGEDGRFVAHILASGDRMRIDEARRHPEAATALLRHQVEAWMSEFVGPMQIEAQIVPRTGFATLHVHAGGFEDEWMLLTNTGFGISYILPIVVAALSVPGDALLIIDSPEAHLHPAAQSALGRFLAVVAASGVQVIVETHSDHVLNGIRRAIATGDSLEHSAAIVYYFGREPTPVRLSIDSRGAMSDWPDGFFDQIETDLREINRRRRG
ncbi:AAA family ATPase [Nocardia harenae]|uniref:AAA family ATPase n=1 Tax=Nocardia harenae TaxID=358707 RepID=UPI0008377F6E|nr:DUF3696 domain-containing protein [Nocardia harenae]